MNTKREDGDLSIRDGKVYMYHAASDRLLETNINAEVLGASCELSVSTAPPREVVDEPRNPDPAPFQVWLPPAADDYAQARRVARADGTLTIERVHENRVYFREGFGCDAGLMARTGWRCIGVEAGRVRIMVGDGFAPYTGQVLLVTVVAVTGQANMRVAFRDGTTSIWSAHQLAPLPRHHYAPARKGELYLLRSSGESGLNKIVVDATIGKFIGEDGIVYRMLSARVPIGQWERLDPVTHSCPTNATSDEAACAPGKSDHIDRDAHTHGPGNSLLKNGIGPATEAARSEHSNPLTQAPLDHTHDLIIDPATLARSDVRWEMGLMPADMRRLDDAIGRALEVGHAEERVTLGLVRLVLAELLISPTVVCAEGVNIAADTKHLRLLRQAIKEAAAKGTATCSPWGKEQTITISRLEVGIDMSKAP